MNEIDSKTEVTTFTNVGSRWSAEITKTIKTYKLTLPLSSALVFLKNKGEEFVGYNVDTRKMKAVKVSSREVEEWE